MSRLRVLEISLGMLVCTQAATTQSPSLATLQTRAERSGFTETSRYDDVMAFLKVVDEASPLVHVTQFGFTF
jgi:hypothetical protein